jgi:hypothetical protein
MKVFKPALFIGSALMTLMLSASCGGGGGGGGGEDPFITDEIAAFKNSERKGAVQVFTSLESCTRLYLPLYIDFGELSGKDGSSIDFDVSYSLEGANVTKIDESIIQLCRTEGEVIEKPLIASFKLKDKTDPRVIYAPAPHPEEGQRDACIITEVSLRDEAMLSWEGSITTRYASSSRKNTVKLADFTPVPLTTKNFFEGSIELPDGCNQTTDCSLSFDVTYGWENEPTRTSRPFFATFMESFSTDEERRKKRVDFDKAIPTTADGQLDYVTAEVFLGKQTRTAVDAYGEQYTVDRKLLQKLMPGETVDSTRLTLLPHTTISLESVRNYLLKIKMGGVHRSLLEIFPSSATASALFSENSLTFDGERVYALADMDPNTERLTVSFSEDQGRTFKETTFPANNTVSCDSYAATPETAGVCRTAAFGGSLYMFGGDSVNTSDSNFSITRFSPATGTFAATRFSIGTDRFFLASATVDLKSAYFFIATREPAIRYGAFGDSSLGAIPYPTATATSAPTIHLALNSATGKITGTVFTSSNAFYTEDSGVSWTAITPEAGYTHIPGLSGYHCIRKIVSSGTFDIKCKALTATGFTALAPLGKSAFYDYRVRAGELLLATGEPQASGGYTLAYYRRAADDTNLQKWEETSKADFEALHENDAFRYLPDDSFDTIFGIQKK